jgi:5-dehydro-2-deoxygluconokinase
MGIDREGMIFDKTGAPNCIAMTYILSPEESGSFFYRNGTADLLITPEEISEDYIANASAVVLSGTAFSLSPSREAMLQIIEYARRNDTKIIMDIDYRPFGWSSREETAEVTNQALENCHMIIGNREEFDIVEQMRMSGNRDNAVSASYYLKKSAELVIIKDGANGSVCFQKNEEPIRCGIIPTMAIKTFGSGDAYAAGLVYGLLKGFPVLDAMRFGSACASITLQKVSCAEGMPYPDQVNRYLAENKFTE